MKVFKKHIYESATPYTNNCYIATIKENELDVDVTTPFSYFAFVPSGQIDYIQYRDLCKEFILPQWSSISEEEKKELVRHNIAPTEEDKLVHYTIEEQKINFFELLRLEKQARFKRWEYAKQLIAFEYRLNQMNQLLMYQDTKPYKDDFIDADLPYLIYWINSAALPQLGIDFTSNGFNSKSYYSETIKNKVLSILLNNVTL